MRREYRGRGRSEKAGTTRDKEAGFKDQEHLIKP
jgi:hypothetical protein